MEKQQIIMEAEKQRREVNNKIGKLLADYPTFNRPEEVVKEIKHLTNESRKLGYVIEWLEKN